MASYKLKTFYGDKDRLDYLERLMLRCNGVMPPLKLDPDNLVRTLRQVIDIRLMKERGAKPNPPLKATR